MENLAKLETKVLEVNKVLKDKLGHLVQMDQTELMDLMDPMVFQEWTVRVDL
ncbi:hypothetical protein [Salmonella sp. s51228]|uniref:hypothetical protein n=1 Tax=Salmonella sp. s51228 TaxID=3159652 RepID=UPI00397F0EE3